MGHLGQPEDMGSEVNAKLREAFNKALSEMFIGTAVSHEPWPFGTVIRSQWEEGRPLTHQVAMWLGNNMAVPLSGYAYTDHHPVPIDPRFWDALPEDES